MMPADIADALKVLESQPIPLMGPPVKIRGMTRRCGPCSACCVWVRVEFPEGAKPTGEACRHLAPSGRGCGIYARRPDICRAWSCRWLFDPTTHDLPRPDQAGYVLGCQTQEILIDEILCHAIQINVDPARPGAHKDPALRTWLRLMWDRYGLVGLVRVADQDIVGAEALVLIPPLPSDPDGEWLERTSAMSSKEEHEAKVAAARSGGLSDGN